MQPAHDPTNGRFFIANPEGDSVLVYTLDPSAHRMTITHTFVPPPQRGRGQAELLTRAALAWAAAEHLRVIPACSYVARFITRHHDFHHLTASGG